MAVDLLQVVLLEFETESKGERSRRTRETGLMAHRLGLLSDSQAKS